MKQQLLFEKFPYLEQSGKLKGDYGEAVVVSVGEDKAARTLNIQVMIKELMPLQIMMADPLTMEELIAKETGMKAVTIDLTMKPQSNNNANTEAAANNQTTANDNTAKPKAPLSYNASKVQNTTKNQQKSDQTAKPKISTKPAKPILGRIVSTKPKKLENVTIEDGKVTIKGDIRNIRHHQIKKNSDWYIIFDITDYTGTLTVKKYFPGDKAQALIRALKNGMTVTVSGRLFIDDYDRELTLEPENIFASEKEKRTDTAETKRVELHLHSKMSAMDAVTDIKQAITRACDWGHPAIAITDHGVVQAFPEASYATYNKDINVIYGLEGYFETTPESPKKSKNHIIILAKNQTGLKNLYKLVSESHLNFFSRKRPVIGKDLLDAHRGGLIIGTACESGELFEAIVAKKSDTELEEIAKYYDYLEIQPLCNNMFMLSKDSGGTKMAKNEEELRDFNRKVVEIGKKLDIPVVATCDAHFLDPHDEIFRKIILTDRGYDARDLALYFRTTDEMLEEFSYLGEETAYEVVVTNTNKIAQMCSKVSPLPPYGKLYPPKLEGSAEELRRLVGDRTQELYGRNRPKLIEERVSSELGDILDSGYDVIYMAAQKIVADALRNKTIRGSRGSVGSSFVAYLADITEVNPLPPHYRCPDCKNVEFYRDIATTSDDASTINNATISQSAASTESATTSAACGPDLPDRSCVKCGTAYIKDGFNIPFETFLGFAGDKVPDIDLNFSGDYHKQAHEFTNNLFGEENIFRAGTISKLKDKSTYRVVKKYLEKTEKNVTNAEQARLAEGCTGVKQSTGQHPGGLFVLPDQMKITDFCPVQHPADDKDKGVITTHFDYKSLGDNLIKLDLLGHDDPTMLKMLEDLTGISSYDISLDDKETMSIFSSPTALGLKDNDPIIGKTGAIGIPEFGTLNTRTTLTETMPKDFDSLIKISGFSHGEKVWRGNAKELIESGIPFAETIGCRDDIMLFLISKGIDEKDAFTISENVRKEKGVVTRKMEDLMRRHGVPDWYIDSCHKITYLFPKAHATAYVIQAFKIAWYKVHKPLEYYSAHFYRRSMKGRFDTEMMTSGIDAVKQNIREINAIPARKRAEKEQLLVTLESVYEFYLRGFDFSKVDFYKSDATKFLPEDEKKLRPPFIAIGGVGEIAARTLAEKSKGKNFISIEEIASECTGVSKTTIDKLKSLGAFGDLPESTQMSLF